MPSDNLTADRRWRPPWRARGRFGAGIVAVRHGFHFGTARRYAIQAAEAGCIGIAMCNTRPLMPAPGGAERLVGNNPIAIAFPADGPIPIVLDMATSEAAMGKIRMARKAGRHSPDLGSQIRRHRRPPALPMPSPACCFPRAARKASGWHSWSI